MQKAKIRPMSPALLEQEESRKTAHPHASICSFKQKFNHVTPEDLTRAARHAAPYASLPSSPPWPCLCACPWPWRREASCAAATSREKMPPERTRAAGAPDSTSCPRFSTSSWSQSRILQQEEENNCRIRQTALHGRSPGSSIERAISLELLRV